MQCELDLEGPVKVGLAKEREELHRRMHLLRLTQHAEWEEWSWHMGGKVELQAKY